MEKILIRFLDKNYYLTLESMSKFYVLGKNNNPSININILMEDMGLIFCVNKDDLLRVFNIWVDKESTQINNRIVELQEYYYSMGYKVD